MPGSGERHHRTQETGRTVLSGAAIKESVGRLAGAVAHDFNNLLTVINGYTEITFDSLPAGSHLAQRLGEVRSAGRRAAELTQQLLAFSRKQVVQPTVLDVNSVVNNIEKMLAANYW